MAVRRRLHRARPIPAYKACPYPGIHREKSDAILRRYGSQRRTVLAIFPTAFCATLGTPRLKTLGPSTSLRKKTFGRKMQSSTREENGD